MTDFHDKIIGWQIRQANWYFCSRLYHKWKIVLDYGEYTMIRKTIQRGIGYRFPGTKPGTTIYVIPFRTTYLPIVGEKRGTRLITVLGASEFKQWARKIVAGSTAAHLTSGTILEEGDRSHPL